MERNDYLIRKKFYSYLIPGVMMAAALQLGNLLDSIFVGKILGMKALSASSLGVPVVFFAQVFLMIFAVGGSTAAAVCLGKRENSKASRIFRLSFFCMLILQAANAAASFLYVGPVARAMSADAEMAQMCASFMQIYMVGLVPVGAATFLAYFMAVDNHPKESAALHIAANVINLVMDYLFLKVFQTGIAGAVYSTIAGYGAAGLFFGIRYFRSPRRMLRFRAPEAKPAEGALLPEIAKTGAAAGVLLLLSAAKILILNGAVLRVTGEDGLSVYVVTTNSMFLIQLCLTGIVGVLPTIGGILSGDRDYFGIRRLMKRIVTISIAVSLILAALFFIAPGLIGGMFGFDLEPMRGTMNLCLRLFALSFPFYAVNGILQSYYPTVEKPWYATLNTVLQGLVILLPATFLLLAVMGVSGTGLASAVTEALSLLSVLLLIRIRQGRKKETGSDMLLIPRAGNENALDITVKGTTADAAGVAHRLVEYCVGEGVSRHVANAVGIAGEELVDNIAQYSGQDERISYIDVCLLRDQGKLILRVRDDGVPFDPADYALHEAENGARDDLEVGGLRLILSLAEKVDYSRVLNMNNTVVVISERAARE